MALTASQKALEHLRNLAAAAAAKDGPPVTSPMATSSSSIGGAPSSSSPSSAAIPLSRDAATGLSTSILNKTKAALTAVIAGVRMRQASTKEPLLTQQEQTPMVMGALVSLYSADGEGYFISEGFVDTDCSVPCPDSKTTTSRIPSNFEDCVFRIVPKYKYDARNELNETLGRFNRDKSSISKGRANSGDGSFLFLFLSVSIFHFRYCY